MLGPRLPYVSSKQFVLASQSPRRQEILRTLGLQPAIEPSRFDERTLRDEKFGSPAEYVVASAERKGAEVAGRVAYDVLLSADTVVVLGERILEKPSSEAEAIEFLRLLSGRAHSVLTGVSLRTATASVKFVEKTEVEFAQLPDTVISSYVASGEPMDKAGAYGIQGMGGSLVRGIRGCYFNVMGLPMHRVALELAALVESGKL